MTPIGTPGQADIRALTLIVTAECNLRCTYCYQDKKSGCRASWSIARAGIDLLLSSRLPKVSLLLTGGEALLEWRLILRAIAYAEHHRRQSQRVTYSISTNGLLLDEDKVAFLERYGAELQISFDGVPNAQRLRGRGTFGRLDRLLENLRFGHPHYLSNRTTVAVTVPIAAIRYLADSVEYLIAKGVRKIALMPAMGQHGWRRERIRALDQQFGRVFRSSLAHYRLTGDVPVALFRKEGRPRSRARRRSACAAAVGRSPVVDVDGRVFTCVMLAESYQAFPDTPLVRPLSALCAGDVRDPDLVERLSGTSERARAAAVFTRPASRYSSYGRCADCQYASDCFICPVAGIKDPRIDPLRVPDYLCAFSRVALAYRARFPRQPSLVDHLLLRAPVPAAVRRVAALAGRANSRLAASAARRPPAPA